MSADQIPAQRERQSELDRAYRTINEIERVLADHGVAITAPLADAVLALFSDRVPCDDAAIERAAAVLDRWYGPSRDRLHIATAILRAAGETP